MHQRHHDRRLEHMHEAGVERFRDNEVVVVAGPHDLLLVLNDEE